MVAILMIVETNLKPKNYKHNEVCRIVNPKQAKLYIKNKVYPIDLYVSKDKNNNDIIVYIFTKKDTQDVYRLWKDYDLG